jgi:hypothetical protein
LSKASDAWWARQGLKSPGSSIPVVDKPSEQNEKANTAELFHDRAKQLMGGSPDWTYQPTRSSNPGNPRTGAMEYYKLAQVLIVYWGDGGTPFAYYQVTPDIARRIQKSASPGKFIERILNNYPYGKWDG